MNLTLQQPNNETEADGLILWVAYIPDGEKKRYLGNGKGGVRVWKSEGEINIYLDENTTPEFRAGIVVHSVAGEIIVPLEDGLVTPSDVATPAPIPTISTLAVDSAPTSSEVLADMLLRRKRANQTRKGKQ